MSEQESKPWWKHGYVWMVIGGPAVVVVAGFITLYLAIASPNPMVQPDGVRGVPETATTGDKGVTMQEGLAPAMQARNHAATGGLPPATPKTP